MDRAALKVRAEALGFDACGVARARRLERDGATLERWLAAGGNASMAWLAKEPGKRSDPRELLAGCRSVVVVAVDYFSEARPREGLARVARYAGGRDYHKVLGRRARELASWIDATTGATSRAFVDTGPVLERGWAEAAGVGWIGKNANLLTRDRGSWLLLGCVLTTEEIEPDAGPHAEFCGTCTACLDACPTQAIVEPGFVDANRCIAYWTIEHRGPVPEDRREGNGEWIFGCDVCQEVCPWNVSFARGRDDDPFGRRDDLLGLDPTEILALDEATFRARYSGTALMRAKWEGMRRNACIVLGNRRDPASRGVLERALEDPDPVVRAHARWAIGRLSGPGLR
ncbi:MAG TPA: tRNA epoxyqueuosine(34) reductase QueG [Candidatus Polarisedimenticolaceae bacterium]